MPEEIGTKVPRLTFINNTLDLGTFKGDSIRRGYVAFTNTGSDTLQIYRVISDCGCTVAKTSGKVIPPGASDSIMISFDGRGRAEGYFKKVVRLRTNDGLKAAFVCGTIRKSFHR